VNKLRITKKYRQNALAYSFAFGVAGLFIGLLPFISSGFAIGFGIICLVFFLVVLIVTK